DGRARRRHSRGVRSPRGSRPLSLNVDRVRDAMVADPRALPGTASAREAGGLLTRPQGRAGFGAGGGRVTRGGAPKTLGAAGVAGGRDPATTTLASIAEEPRYTIGPDLPLEDAFRFLEEHDAERVPVVEDGRLIGVLSRSVLQRRLAEDEPPADAPED